MKSVKALFIVSALTAVATLPATGTIQRAPEASHDARVASFEKNGEGSLSGMTYTRVTAG